MRANAQEQQNPSALARSSGDGDDDDEASVCGVSLAEAATATKVLVALAAEPEAFRGKEFKALRAALHTLRQSEGASMVLGFGMREVALVQVVSDALRDGRWSDALGALEKMRQRKQVLKLGSLSLLAGLSSLYPLYSLVTNWYPQPKVLVSSNPLTLQSPSGPAGAKAGLGAEVGPRVRRSRGLRLRGDARAGFGAEDSGSRAGGRNAERGGTGSAAAP